jgi:hypothetical protein
MPTKVFFGSGCVSENGAELKALGSRAMIVTGKHSSRINGSLAAVEQALQANGQTYVIFDEIEENPSVETVAVAAGIAVKEQVDFFVAVGGGSPMDASKAISLLAANPSAIDHAEERLYHPEPMQGYPVAAVPTTSGTGSEVTPYAILTRHDLHTKQSIAHKWFADLAFVDAGYLKTSSYENMVSTCVDALAHLIESYLNTNANAYNRIYSAEGLRIWGRAKEIQKAQKAIESGECAGKAVPEVAEIMGVVKKKFPEASHENMGFGSTIFAVKPGDGSAREQAASCQKVLGGWANIANEYATKRYRSNLINWGMLPFIIDEGELPFHNLDYIFLPGIKKEIEDAKTEFEAYVVKDGELKPFTLKMGELTDDEREIILKGCLINYNRK